MELGLRGRVAVVTGGSKGIGRAIAEGLAREGVGIAICARDAAALESAEAELRKFGVNALAVQADVSRAQDIAHFVASAARHFDRIDILVNNAVTSTQNTFDALSDEEFRHHIDVKLLGYVRCARAVLPHLRKNGWGRILNIAGMTARIVSEYRMTNGVVNSAVTNFTKHLAEQVGKDGITVNAIHPGYTWTPRLEAMLERLVDLEKTPLEELRMRRVREIPIGRFIQPADIANLAVFLCSEAAGAITGQAMAVDGGSGRSISY